MNALSYESDQGQLLCLTSALKQIGNGASDRSGVALKSVEPSSQSFLEIF